MASPPSNRAREEQRRLDLRTLGIASVASASAALIVSRLWFAGTWIAAALTPVIVAVVSEVLHRPADKLAESRSRPHGGAPRAAPLDQPASDQPQIRVYRQPSPRARKSRIALGTVAVTALLAFAIAGAAITLPELVAGQSVGGGDRKTTLFDNGSRDRTRDATTDEQTTETVTETTTTETAPRPTTDETTRRSTPEQATPPETTTTETAPQQTTPAPTTQAPAPQTAPTTPSP